MSKIFLIGKGKMGQMLQSLAPGCGCQVVESIDEADVCIDFSHPDAVIGNIELALSKKKNIVVGTTGWYDQLDQVKEMVGASDCGFLYASNFSIGVHLFMQVVKQASDLILQKGLYDVALTEAHHNEKVDTPSGTALSLKSVIGQKSVPVSSVRCGSIPGTHSVIFDSPCDTITLEHKARNREGFATGALEAAKWLANKKGFYTMDDFIFNQEVLCR